MLSFTFYENIDHCIYLREYKIHNKIEHQNE